MPVTPAYVSRETGAALLDISVDTWDAMVKGGRHGVDVPENEIEAFVRDDLKPHPSQKVVAIVRHAVEGGRLAPQRLSP